MRDQNVLFHQLELANLLSSNTKLPGFYSKIPSNDIREFFARSVGGVSFDWLELP
jgi:hypothetical protein